MDEAPRGLAWGLGRRLGFPVPEAEAPRLCSVHTSGLLPACCTPAPEMHPFLAAALRTCDGLLKLSEALMPMPRGN